MTVNDLIKYLNDYKANYPDMANNDIIFSLPKSLRYQGAFYYTYKATSIGINRLVSTDNISIGIEPISIIRT